jgi:hypothetical protein
METVWWVKFWEDDCGEKQKDIQRKIEKLNGIFLKDMNNKDQYYHGIEFAMKDIVDDVTKLARTQFMLKMMRKC